VATAAMGAAEEGTNFFATDSSGFPKIG
jgi:hypothetical protein